MRIEKFHVRYNLLNGDFDYKSSMPRHFLKFVYFGFFSIQLRFEIRSHFNKFFSFLPFPHIFISAVFTLTFEDTLS